MNQHCIPPSHYHYRQEENKKRIFSKTEMEVLVGEVEVRKGILFGGHSSWVTNKRTLGECLHGFN